MDLIYIACSHSTENHYACAMRTKQLLCNFVVWTSSVHLTDVYWCSILTCVYRLMKIYNIATCTCNRFLMQTFHWQNQNNWKPYQWFDHLQSCFLVHHKARWYFVYLQFKKRRKKIWFNNNLKIKSFKTIADKSQFRINRGCNWSFKISAGYKIYLNCKDLAISLFLAIMCISKFELYSTKLALYRNQGGFQTVLTDYNCKTSSYSFEKCLKMFFLSLFIVCF